MQNFVSAYIDICGVGGGALRGGLFGVRGWCALLWRACLRAVFRRWWGGGRLTYQARLSLVSRMRLLGISTAGDCSSATGQLAYIQIISIDGHRRHQENSGCCSCGWAMAIFVCFIYTKYCLQKKYTTLVRGEEGSVYTDMGAWGHGELRQCRQPCAMYTGALA